MIGLSVGQKVVIHLMNHTQSTSDFYNSPWEITQDGIATALRISRAHASIELKKLKNNEMVAEEQVHVKGSKSKRKTYQLTSKGRDEYNNIKEFASANSINIDLVMNCQPEKNGMIIGKLNDEERYAVGCACVFRIPVTQEILPKTNKSVLPANSMGTVMINEKMRKDFLAGATQDELTTWHSYAADYWLEDDRHISDNIDSMHERLYHLVMAGRQRDACKIISANMYEFILTSNDDLHDTLAMITKVPDAYAIDVYSVMIDVDIQSGDFESAAKNVELLSSKDRNAADLYRSDLELAKGNADNALEILRKIENETPVAGIRIANIMAYKGDYVNARKYANSVKCGSTTNPSIGVERFILLSKIDKKEGKDADAYAHLMKARASVSEKGKKRIDSLISELNYNTSVA